MLSSSIVELQRFLQQADPWNGVPLVVGAMVLMLFGWRLWRVCMILTYAIVGYSLGSYFASTANSELLFSIGGAIVLAGAGLAPMKFSVPLLGGVCGACVGLHMLAGMGFRDMTLWIGTGVVLFGCTGLAAIYRRYVIIVLTSIEGAVLLFSGLVLLSRVSPDISGFISESLGESVMVLPFMLLVPASMGFFYQVSEVHRTGCDM